MSMMIRSGLGPDHVGPSLYQCGSVVVVSRNIWCLKIQLFRIPIKSLPIILTKKHFQHVGILGLEQKRFASTAHTQIANRALHLPNDCHLQLNLPNMPKWERGNDLKLQRAVGEKKKNKQKMASGEFFHKEQDNTNICALILIKVLHVVQCVVLSPLIFAVRTKTSLHVDGNGRCIVWCQVFSFL